MKKLGLIPPPTAVGALSGRQDLVDRTICGTGVRLRFGRVVRQPEQLQPRRQPGHHRGLPEGSRAGCALPALRCQARRLLGAQTPAGEPAPAEQSQPDRLRDTVEPAGAADRAVHDSWDGVRPQQPAHHPGSDQWLSGERFVMWRGHPCTG